MEDFMRRYMWPNSCLPSATALVAAAHTAARGRFTLERVENHAAHYPRTLREWGRRLDARLTPAALGLVGAGLAVDKLGAPKGFAADSVSDVQRGQTLLQTLPTSAGADADAFEALKRKWQYLFAYAAAGFQKGYITCKRTAWRLLAGPLMTVLPGHMLTFVRSSDVADT
jgi:cyclopropane-fatty-acyl-phospholipid synthase